MLIYGIPRLRSKMCRLDLKITLLFHHQWCLNPWDKKINFAQVEKQVIMGYQWVSIFLAYKGYLFESWMTINITSHGMWMHGLKPH
jgi:hypothetical protein